MSPSVNEHFQTCPEQHLDLCQDVLVCTCFGFQLWFWQCEGKEGVGGGWWWCWTDSYSLPKDKDENEAVFRVFLRFVNEPAARGT